MKKIVLTLTAAMIFAWQGPSFASSSVDALIQKLEDKGILTNQEASEIKDEVSTNEQSSQQATFKTLLPDWINGFKLSGDFRFRDQANYTKAKIGAGADNFHQNRARIRARLNFEDQINDKFKMIVGIATDGGSPRSNNYTLGGTSLNSSTSDSFSKPQIVLNKAYAVYTPASWSTIMVGKMDNPIWEPGNASFFWDPDITPEGGSIQLQKKLNDYVTPFFQEALFDMHSTTPTSSLRTDPYMMITQGGIKGNLTDKIYYKGALTWYDYNNPSRFVSTLSTGTNSLVPGGSSLLYSFNNVISGGVELGMNDPFGDMLPNPIYIPQIGVMGDYSQNNASGVTQNKAWLIGGYMGNSALNGWGTWKLSSFYKVLERDAWLDTLPNDDFYSGDTDTKGWQSEIDIGLAKNVWFDMLYYRTNVFKDVSSVSKLSQSAPNNTFQMDLNFKF